MRNHLVKGLYALAVLVPGAIMLGGVAGAVTTSYDATTALSDSTTFVGTVTSAAAPIILAIAGGVVGLMLLSWAIKTVFSKVRRVAKV